MKLNKFFSFFKKNWVIVAIILIIVFGMYVRLLDYNWPYLRNIDSYVFYRQMDEIVQNSGFLPTHDNYMLSPGGVERPTRYLYVYEYTGAYSYMFVRMFNPGLTLSQFLIYFPAFLAALSAIPLYFIGKLLYNRKAGVLAALLYVFDISNFSRSLGGDPDSDAIIILVSMIVMALFITTYKIASSAQTFNKKVLLFSIMTTLGLWIWYSTWAGYWYLFWLMTGFVVLKLIVDILIKRDIKLVWKNSKIIIYSFLFFIILSFLMTIPSYGMNKINSALAGPVEFQSIKGEDSEFPNVYVSVAELQQSGGPKEIIQRTSAIDGAGILISPFFLMIYALILLLYSFYKIRKHYDTVILLLVWFLGPFFATIVAIRFSILFSAPLAIGSAIFLTIILDYALNKEKTKEKIEEQITEEIV